MLANPAVDCALVGTVNPAHIEEAAAAVDIVLDDDTLAAIETIMRGAVTASLLTPEDV